MTKRLAVTLISALLLSLQAVILPCVGADDKFTKQQLDQMLAPVALYPDDLLTNVLMASTYPLDVVEADRWRRETVNAKLSGDALAKALEGKTWDPSIKALVQFPQVLQTMSEKLDWTQKVGDAFLGQQNEVMDEIQLLRRKADEAGHLKTTDQQKVVKESGSGGQPIYVIEPASPQTVYVPSYQPDVVYGSWWYPSYPPYYWAYPGARFAEGFFWGAGFAIANDIWGWNHFDWHHHNIDINVNKWNTINGDRSRISHNTWEHRPDHRGPVPYHNKDVREKFKQANRDKIGSDDFRGHDRADIKERLKDSDHARIDKHAGHGDDIRNRAGERTRDKIKDRAGHQGKDGNRRTADHPHRKAAPSAFNVKRGADVHRHATRGRASRMAMSHPPHHASGRMHGGGARHMGGGHRHFGGRRR